MRFYCLTYPLATPQPPVRGDEPSFATARAAWNWLLRARMLEEDRYPDWNIGEYSATALYLDYAAGAHHFGIDDSACEFGNPDEDWPLAADGTGRIIGGTPGVGDDDSDLNGKSMVYAVVAR
jgi:hypothetical protein